MFETIGAGKTAVLVPPCMLAPGMQAKKEMNSLWRHAHLQLYLKYQVDIIPYPCAESTFHGYENGLLRSPHGIDYYRKFPEYEHHCQNLASCFTKKILSMQTGGYFFSAIVGIEHSPSCAVSYLYSQHGTLKQSGLFVTALKECFTASNLQIPFVGINRRWPKKSLHEIEKFLQGAVYRSSKG